jgi:hypothetical protein
MSRILGPNEVRKFFVICDRQCNTLFISAYIIHIEFVLRD